MQSTDIPVKFPIPFGNNAGAGYIHAIPTASQIGVVDGAASLHDGFVPLNATPIASGGIPPDIKDMNGVLFETTGWSRWVQAGGPIQYDSGLVTAWGGYPKGAVLQSAATIGVLFVSLVENNLTNPDSGDPSWQALVPVPATLADLVAGTNTTRYVTPATLAGLRASSADVLAGTDGIKYITPAAFYGARATNADVIAGTDQHKYLTPFALASGNSPGIIRLPGIMIQYGVVTGHFGEANFTFSFNTPFTSSVGGVLLTGINPDGSTGANRDIWPQWFQPNTTLSTCAWVSQSSRSDSSPWLSGVSWLAWGN